MPLPTPCIDVLRPITTFTMPLLLCDFVAKTCSIGAAEMLLVAAMSPECTGRRCLARAKSMERLPLSETEILVPAKSTRSVCTGRQRLAHRHP